MPDQQRIMGISEPLPAGRHVTWVSYWDNQFEPQPGDELIRDALRFLGTSTELAEVSVMISNKTKPSFAAGQIEALTAGIPAGAVYNALKAIGGSRWFVTDTPDIPEWISDTWDVGQQTKDTAGQAVEKAQGISKFLVNWGPEILVGIVGSVLAFFVIRELQ